MDNSSCTWEKTDKPKMEKSSQLINQIKFDPFESQAFTRNATKDVAVKKRENSIKMVLLL